MRIDTDLDRLNRQYEESLSARKFVARIFVTGHVARAGTRDLHGMYVTNHIAAPLQKAVVEALSSSSAADLLRESRAFMDVVARRTVLGRLVGTVKAPPNVPIPVATSEPDGVWLVEGAAIPFARIDFTAQWRPFADSWCGPAGTNRSTGP